MQPTIYIAILIITFGIIAILIANQRKQELEEGNSDQKPQTLNSKDEDQIGKKQRIQIIILMLVGVIILAGVTIFMIVKKEAGNSDGDSRSASFIPYLPIWVAIFIPILASKN